MTKRATLIAAALVVPLLAGCADDAVSPADYDYRLAHPLGAETRTAVLRLAVPRQAGTGVSAGDAARISSFVQDFVNKGEGTMELLVVVPSADAAAGGTYADALLYALQAQGVGPNLIAARLVSDDAATAGTAVLRYRQWVAMVPECGQWARDVQTDMRGANAPNFGCATQRNIGLMVANPRDLAGAARQETRPAQAGARVLPAWAAGQGTEGPIVTPRTTE